MNLFQLFFIVLKIFFLSFINIEDGVCKVSKFWMTINTVKLSVLSFLLFTSLIKHIQEKHGKLNSSRLIQSLFFLSMEIFYLIAYWVYFVVKKSTITRSINLAQDFAAKLRTFAQNSKIGLEAKKRCILAFITIQIYNIADFIYVLTKSPFNYDMLMVFYLRFLIYCFTAFFYFASEFLLVCVKNVKANLRKVLKAQIVTILSNETTKFEKMKAFEMLSTAVEHMCSCHQLIFKLCKEFEDMFNMITLLSLMNQLIYVSIEVRRMLLKCFKLDLFSSNRLVVFVQFPLDSGSFINYPQFQLNS